MSMTTIHNCLLFQEHKVVICTKCEGVGNIQGESYKKPEGGYGTIYNKCDECDGSGRFWYITAGKLFKMIPNDENSYFELVKHVR